MQTLGQSWQHHVNIFSNSFVGGKWQRKPSPSLPLCGPFNTRWKEEIFGGIIWWQDAKLLRLTCCGCEIEWTGFYLGMSLVLEEVLTWRRNYGLRYVFLWNAPSEENRTKWRETPVKSWYRTRDDSLGFDTGRLCYNMVTHSEHCLTHRFSTDLLICSLALGIGWY